MNENHTTVWSEEGNQQAGEIPLPPSSTVARVLTPWLGFVLAFIGLVWAGGILLDLGIALFIGITRCSTSHASVLDLTTFGLCARR